MKIYIPEHLRKLEVIDQMAKVIEEYQSQYVQEEQPFDSYQDSLSIDPVKKFLVLCIKPEDIDPGESYRDVIRYLAKLFYSVKGTVKVIQLFREKLGLKIKGDIVYNVRYLSIHIEEVVITNGTSFKSALKDFFDALLYFGELKLKIDKIIYNIEGNLVSKISPGLVKYEHNEVTNLDI